MSDNLSRRVGSRSEKRVEPNVTTFRESRGNEHGIISKLLERYGSLDDLEFWGRALVVSTDNGDPVNVFTDLSVVDLTGVPLFIEHSYPDYEKIPVGSQLDKKKYRAPTPRSRPIGRIMVSDSTIMPGELWIKARLNMTDVPRDRQEWLRRALRSGHLAELSVGYAHATTTHDLDEVGGPAAPNARFREGSRYVDMKEVSLVSKADIYGCGVVLVKAGKEGSEVTTMASQAMSGIAGNGMTTEVSGGGMVSSNQGHSALVDAIAPMAAPQQSSGGSGNASKSSSVDASSSSASGAGHGLSGEQLAIQHLNEMQAIMQQSQQPTAGSANGAAATSASTPKAAQSAAQAQQQQAQPQQQPINPDILSEISKMRAAMEAQQAQFNSYKAEIAKRENDRVEAEKAVQRDRTAEEYMALIGPNSKVSRADARGIVESTKPETLAKIMDSMRALRSGNGGAGAQAFGNAQQSSMTNSDRLMQHILMPAQLAKNGIVDGSASDVIMADQLPQLARGVKPEGLSTGTTAIRSVADRHPASLWYDPLVANVVEALESKKR